MATICRLNICKIQWNIIKKGQKKERKEMKERMATICRLNICKIQWNIIKKGQKKERKQKERKKGN